MFLNKADTIKLLAEIKVEWTNTPRLVHSLFDLDKTIERIQTTENDQWSLFAIYKMLSGLISISVEKEVRKELCQETKQ